MTDIKLCNVCGSEEVIPARYNIGYRTCMKCGEVMAGKRKFTVVPMHKSNYVVISNRQELKGINNKGGLYETSTRSMGTLKRVVRLEHERLD